MTFNRTNSNYKEDQVGGVNGPRRNPQGAVGMPNGPKATPRYREGAVGMPNGPTATPNYNQQNLQDQENANLDNPNYREGRVGGYKGPTAVDPMYGAPTPAFPEEDPMEREARDYQQGPEANQARIDAARQATQNDQKKIDGLTSDLKNSNLIGRDALGGSFNNSDTQGKSNQAMSPQAPAQAAPAQAAQAQADQFRRYHGTAYDPNSKLDRAKMKALQGAGVQMDKSGMGPQAKATKQTLTAADMYDKPNPNARFAKAGR